MGKHWAPAEDGGGGIILKAGGGLVTKRNIRSYFTVSLRDLGIINRLAFAPLTFAINQAPDNTETH